MAPSPPPPGPGRTAGRTTPWPHPSWPAGGPGAQHPIATPWSVRTLARHTGISKSTAHRRLQASNLQPRRHRHCNTSNDPHLGDTVQHVMGPVPIHRLTPSRSV
ncbi:MAG: helix-turn-helix domain-containing protein [Synechococcus sp. SB0668_bin_13]|nr:helix-turn-helix domain-containing protein [Synechococcus sp. SB0668_bin_13]